MLITNIYRDQAVALVSGIIDSEREITNSALAVNTAREIFARIKRPNEWLISDYYGLDWDEVPVEQRIAGYDNINVFGGLNYAHPVVEEQLHKAALQASLEGNEYIASSCEDAAGRIFLNETVVLWFAHEITGKVTRSSIAAAIVFFLNHERQHTTQDVTFMNQGRTKELIAGVTAGDSDKIREYMNLPAELEADKNGLEAVKEYFHS